MQEQRTINKTEPKRDTYPSSRSPFLYSFLRIVAVQRENADEAGQPRNTSRCRPRSFTVFVLIIFKAIQPFCVGPPHVEQQRRRLALLQVPHQRGGRHRPLQRREQVRAERLLRDGARRGVPLPPPGPGVWHRICFSLCVLRAYRQQFAYGVMIESTMIKSRL